MVGEKLETITVKEARKILGVKAEGLNDTEVRRLIQTFSDVARLIIKNYTILKTSK